MTKKKAFLIHLGVSLLVFSILLMLIIYLWYPSPYFDAEYRMQWIRLIAFVDVVIGPGLTLLVYRENKPSIRFDMAVILTLQLLALSWGVWNAWSIHPKLNVYFDGAVYCLDHQEIKKAGVDRNLFPGYMTGQIMAVLPYPETIEKKLEYLTRGKSDKPMVFGLGHLYEVADSEMTKGMDEKQRDFIEVANSDEQYQKEWQKFMQSHKAVNNDWRFYNFQCLEEGRTIVFNREQNTVEGVLKIKLPIDWRYF